MNKLTVHFFVVIFFGMGALHATAGAGAGAGAALPLDADTLNAITGVDVAAVADKLAKDLELGAAVIDAVTEITGPVTPEAVETMRRGRCHEALARWYRSTCCGNFARTLTNPAFQGAMQATLIVLGTTLVVSYLMVIPTSLLLAGGIAARLVERQRALDAAAQTKAARRDGGALVRAGGSYDDGTAAADAKLESIAVANNLFETEQGRAYIKTFNRAMKRLGRRDKISLNQPIPPMLVHIVAMVKGTAATAATGDARGAGGSHRYEEDPAWQTNWQAALRTRSRAVVTRMSEVKAA